MCVVSMVHDHFGKRFDPWIPESTPNAPTAAPFVINWPPPPVDIEELRALIKEFREAMAAAKTVDFITKQPDCVDPEKAKLQDRVAELEAKLAAIAKTATTDSV